MDIKDLLTDLGYQIKDFGVYWTTNALYRDGIDPGSLCIYHRNNVVCDFVLGERFSIETLIAKTLGLKSQEEVQKFLTQKSCFVTKNTHFNPQIILAKTYPLDSLNKLIPNHEYWVNRKISESVVSQFRGGVCNLHKLSGRYVFPIIRQENKKEEIVGFTGRALNPETKCRWLHFGSKNVWCYPTFINEPIIKSSKQVILVEGIGDMLSLFECGIKNVLVTFGIEMCKHLLLYLLRIDPESIIISFNDDSQNSNAGNSAAIKLKARLSNYFSENKIKIVFPTGSKDWNDVLCSAGKSNIIKQFEGIVNNIN